MSILNGPLVNGEARVDVLIDVPAPRASALLRAGLQVPATLAKVGMIDTGATLTCIDPSIRKALNLTPYTVRSVGTPGAVAPAHCNYYKVDLTVVHPSRIQRQYLVKRLLTVVELA